MDPMKRFSQWLSQAARAGIDEPGAMALATVGAGGRPTVRIVALRGLDERGFVFYSHRDSPKGRDLARNPRAALCWHWRELGRQVRVEGRCRAVTSAEADAYFASRPREAQLGAWASHQSRPLASRRELLARVRAVTRRFQGRDVPRPPGWSGWRVIPERIEFWRAVPARLHVRELYRLSGATWHRSLLQP
jgi:pyridoxamine 5'-phosphate oxidase